MSNNQKHLSEKAAHNAQILYDSVEHALETDVFTLKPKQREALQAMLRQPHDNITHSYFKLPTGFGKTVMFSVIARAYINRLTESERRNNKVIIFVPRLILSEQTIDALNEFADIHAAEFNGCVSKKNKAASTEENVIVSTYNSLDNLIESVGVENIGLIIADEAHHILGPLSVKKLTKLGLYAPIIGFTATPAYKEEQHIERVLPTEIYSMTIKQGVYSNMLCPVKNILYRTSVICDASKIKSKSNGDFDFDEISSKIKTNILVDEIAEIYMNGSDNGHAFRNMRAIINCPNIDIAEKQADKINELAGENIAITIHSKIKNFKNLKSDFLAGKFRVACQVNTMTEGFDDKTVNMCINYPSRSAVKIEQASGRALRIDDTNPDKIAYVLDTVFRTSAQEEISELLIGAKNAGQVLFSDVADGFLLTPKFIDATATPNIASLTRKKHESENNFVGFDVVTDATRLMEIHNTYAKTVQANHIKQKTAEWKNAAELQEFLIGTATKIRDILHMLHTELPRIIQPRKSGSRIALCLNINHIDEFVQKTGLRQQNLKFKTTDWLGADDLSKILLSKAGTISKMLRIHRKDLPEHAVQDMRCGRTIGVCLHQDFVEMFCQVANISKRTVQKKLDEWKTSHELEQYFKTTDVKILSCLRQLQSDMPYAIQEKQAGSCITLCLHQDYINEFAEKSKLPLRDLTLNRKTADWLTVGELRNIYIGGEKKIAPLIEQYATIMPHAIQRKISGKRTAPLCLHVNYIQEFANVSGLKVKDKSLQRKTQEWLNAADLNKIVFTEINKLTSMLETYRIQMPYAIERKQNFGRTPLCLHKNYIDEFIAAFNLRRR